MVWCDRQVGQHVRSTPQARRAAKITGIDELGASGLVASVGDFGQFKNAAQFGAWLGIVPRESVTLSGVSEILCVRRFTELTSLMSSGPCQAAGGAPVEPCTHGSNPFIRRCRGRPA